MRSSKRRGARAVRAGAAGLVLLALAAVAAPLLTAADPYAPALGERLRPPGPGHPLGQDALGRDVLARVLHGARISLLVGGITVVLSLAAGLTLGAAAGFAGGWLDEVLMRSIDVLLAFPGLLLASLVLALFEIVAVAGSGQTQPAQTLERHEFVIRDFHTESGVVLPEAHIVYTTLGTSHQSTEDVAALRALPHISILSPADAQEMMACMTLACGIGPMLS